MPETLTSAELEQIGLIAIIRTELNADMMFISMALADGGVKAIEITLNTPGALPGITAVREALSPTVRVGAGTILSVEDAQAAHEAGAEFIVTPTLQTDTVAYCRQHGLPIACGCFTPTEALAAHRAGADFVKLFPADNLGPGYIRALHGPMPFLKIMPTGGVSLDNIVTYVRAGCAGVAIGGNLVSKQKLIDEDWPGLTALSRKYVDVFASARAAKEGGKL